MVENTERISRLESRMERLERTVIYSDRKWRFTNNNVIFKNGIAIDPKSPEGETIEKILAVQNKTRLDNLRQRKKWEELTGKTVTGK